MTDEPYPLLNGETVDIAHQASRMPDFGVETGNKRILSAAPWFIAGELPPWLTYQTDNGPGSPTFNTDGSITLETGTTSSDDMTYLETPVFDYADFESVRFYAIDSVCNGSTGNATLEINWADDPNLDNATEGFGYIQFGRTAYRHFENGTELFSGTWAPGIGTTNTLGARIEDHEYVSGKGAYPEFNGLASDCYHENEQGFPSTGPRSMTFGVRTLNTAVTRTLTLDNIYIELVK